MNKGIKTNKVLSLILAIAMIATMVLPISVFAADLTTATATVIENIGGGQTKTITIPFGEAVTMEGIPALDLEVSVAGKTFDISSMDLDASGENLVITLDGAYDVAVGDTITIADNVFKGNVSGEYYFGNVAIVGKLDVATIDYSNVLPAGAEIEFEGYASAPTEVGKGSFSYTVSASNYQSKTDVLEITADELGTTVYFDVQLSENAADYTALDAKILVAKAYNEDDYTPTSYAVLKQAILDAEGVADDLTFSQQSIIDGLVGDIDTAIAGLISAKAVNFTAVAVADDANVNYAKATKIMLVFGEPINAAEADVLSSLSIKDKIASATWKDTAKTILELTISGDLTNGTTITYTTNNAVKTVAEGKVLHTVENVPVVGNLEEASALVTATKMTATIVKASAKPGANAGDKIVFVFNAPIKDNPSTITIDGKTANVVDTSYTVYTYTLASDGEYDDDSTFAYAAITAVGLNGTFGTAVAPKVLVAIAVDVDGTAKTENDEIIVIFDKPTNAAKDISAIAAFGTGAEANWYDNDTKLVITLGAGATIANGDDIDLSSMEIKDEYGKALATNTNIAVEGSFGTVTAPKALKAYAVDNDGTVLVKDDEIVVVFDTPTNEATIDLTKSGILTGMAGASFGSNSAFAWEEDGTKLVITIGDTATVANGVSINLAGQGIMDKDGIVDANIAPLAVEGSFGYTIQPRITKAVAFTQNNKDYIRVFFNTEVKAKAGETIDVTLSGGFDMGVSANTRLVDEGNGLTYYEIVMEKDEHSAFTSGAYTVSLTGIVDKETGSKELATTPFTITGAFISPITPEVLKVVAISNDGSGIAKAGDKIVVVFNTEVKLGTVDAVDGFLGTGYSVDYSSSAKNVVEIVLGDAGLNVEPGTTKIKFTGFKDEATESVTMATTTELVDGNFGYSPVPEILKATAVSADGSGIPKAGDKIVVVFNTMVTYNTNDIYYYEYTLATDGEYNIGDSFDITVKSKATGIEYPLSKAITGSFGYSVLPTVKSVVLSEAAGIETITVIFDRATNMQTIENAILATFRANNEHLGTTATAMWENDTVLKITLGANATTREANVLNLSGLGIKAADTGAEVTGIEALAITGSLIPVVKDVRFAGNTIVMTFSTRTNGVANISNLTALLGVGSTVAWSDNNKVLTITLGENYTITNNGYIVVNGMGIYDAFAGDYNVVGQYKVLGSIETDKLTVAKVVAQSTDKSKTTAQKGDTIVIKFNSATNLKGASLNTILNSAAVDEIVTVAGGNEAAFGTGYTGTWTAYDTLVITLGGSTSDGAEPPVITGNDPAIAVGTTINIANVAFANGEGTMDATDIALSGSFNGREFILTNGALTRTNGTTGDYRVSVKAENTMLNMSVVPTFVCVAYKGTSPVSVMRINVDVENTIQPVFEFAEGLGITSAKVYVFSEIFGDINSSPAVLAETVEIK